MRIFHSLASLILKKRIQQIEAYIKHPIETQDRVFHSLISSAANTEWGKKYGYNSIQSIKDFQERVPVSTYEVLFPYIEKTLSGEKDVLWPGEIKWFSKSSGTTNDKSKFIPISRQSLQECHYKGGRDMMAIYLSNHPNSKVFAGKGLPIGGSHEINKLNQNSYAGDLSAVLIQNTPAFYELFRATSKKIALMSEWERKIELMAKMVIDQNVTSIAGVPTWTLVLFNKMFELTQNSDRNMLDIWPNLEVFFHGGVSFKPYRAQFESVIPSDQMNYFEIYNASEGIFGLQNEPDKEDLLLLLDYGIFYEFIRLEDLGQDHPRAYTLDEVEVDTVYALVISTNAGLWRYLIGDTVRFSQVNPFKITVAGRTKHYINAFGEELMMDNVENGLAIACRETEAVVRNFTVAPVYFAGESNGAHEWLIEFEKSPASLDEFTRLLDDNLKKLNSDYEAKRYKDMALSPPLVRMMPEGTFYKWMKKRGKLGGQNKVPRLFNSRDYIDSILEMLESEGVLMQH